jgi:hypothetical protein
MNGQPKPAFYAAVGLVIVALIAFAIYRSDIFAPAPKANPNVGNIDPQQLPANAEHPDPGPDLMAKEYKFRPRQERLPDPSGVGAYTALDKTDNTVRFALNVWAGWGPIILANDGFKPAHVWKTADGKEFKVELVVIDDPVKMRDAYATGQVHIGWGTLDMIPLFMGGFVDNSGKARDSRIMPRVFQQIDWSNGGDGIVVRDAIKSMPALQIRDEEVDFVPVLAPEGFRATVTRIHVDPWEGPARSKDALQDLAAKMATAFQSVVGRDRKVKVVIRPYDVEKSGWVSF